MFTAIRDRVAAACGAVFVVLILIGNQINVSGTDQSAHPSGRQVLRDVAHQAGSTTATLGFVLEVLGFLALLAFLGYLLDVHRRASGPGTSAVAAATAGVAGVTMLAIKLGSVAPAGALRLDRAGMDPQLAQVLNDMNGVAFVLSWLPFAVLVGAGALGLQRCGLVGRPTGIIGAVIGAGGLVLALIGMQDPVDANPIAFLLGLLWVLVVSVRLAVRPGKAASTAPETAPESATIGAHV